MSYHQIIYIKHNAEFKFIISTLQHLDEEAFLGPSLRSMKQSSRPWKQSRQLYILKIAWKSIHPALMMLLINSDTKNGNNDPVSKGF